MAFNGSASMVQSISDVIVTDTSTGVDATITTRHIFFQRSDGSYLGDTANNTDYWNWPVGPSTITISNLLVRDYAVNATVVWVTPTPDPGGVYTFTQPQLFRYYTMTFLYGLTQEQQVANPKIVSWNDFINNKSILHNYMLEAINAIAVTGDIVNAQGCLNAAYNMTNNRKQYF